MKFFPLKCAECGETWEGPASMIGAPCANNANRLTAARPAVFQCDPEELEHDVDWDAEGGF